MAKDWVIEPLWINHIFVVQGVFIVITNMLVLSTLIGKRHLSTKIHNKYLLVLIAGHLFVGATIFLPVFDVYFTDEVSESSSKILASTHLCTVVWTFCNVVMVASDRLLAIKFPFKYSHFGTRAFYMSLLVAAVITTTVFLLMWHFTLLAYSIFVVLNCIAIHIVVISNALIYLECRKQYDAIKKTFVSNDKNSIKIKTAKLEKKRLSSIKLSLFLVLSFVITWFPASVNCSITIIFGYDQNNPFYPHVVVIRSVVIMFMYLNSCIDPITYILVNRDAKNVIRNSFLRRSATQRSHNEVTTSSTDGKHDKALKP